MPSLVKRLASSPSPWPVRLGTNLGYRFYAHNLHRFHNCDWILGMGRAGLETDPRPPLHRPPRR
ncbi:MAG TPA: hypothetical protein VKM72_01930 [Thermoanaerobaculia bacterium]|nr:hypothetical protein [Thermoanaerobaculia bacterium]